MWKPTHSSPTWNLADVTVPNMPSWHHGEVWSHCLPWFRDWNTRGQSIWLRVTREVPGRPRNWTHFLPSPLLPDFWPALSCRGQLSQNHSSDSWQNRGRAQGGNVLLGAPKNEQSLPPSVCKGKMKTLPDLGSLLANYKLEKWNLLLLPLASDLEKWRSLKSWLQ